MADTGGDKRKGGGDSWDKSKKKAKYSPQSTSGAAIPHNSQGVLITCDTLKDRNTARDILTLVNEVWDESEQKEEDVGGAGASIEKMLASEVADLKDPKQQRFDVLNLGQKTLTYLHKKASGGPSLNDLVIQVLRKAEKTQESRARHCHRILPVETVCFAGLDEIMKAVKPLLERSFPAGDDVTPVSFAVIYASRCCDGLPFDRKKVIDAIAGAVPKPHKVNLDNPDLAILVEVVKSTCCLSILKDYYQLCKYNIRVISTPPEQREATSTKKGKAPGGDAGAKAKSAPEAGAAPAAAAADEAATEAKSEAKEAAAAPTEAVVNEAAAEVKSGAEEAGAAQAAAGVAT